MMGFPDTVQHCKHANFTSVVQKCWLLLLCRKLCDGTLRRKGNRLEGISTIHF
jgi:hypothetical protein